MTERRANGLSDVASDTASVANAVLSGTAPATFTTNESKASSEGSAWFWKMFGGTVIGGITLLSVTLFNHLNSTISSLRTEIVSTQKDHVSLREKFAGLDMSLAALKEKQVAVAELQTKVGFIEQNKELDKERKILIDEALKTIQVALVDLQTKAISIEQSKESLKEIQAIIIDLQAKVASIEQSKEAEKERKLLVDTSIKSVQDELKDLTKTFSDFRERQAAKPQPDKVE